MPNFESTWNPIGSGIKFDPMVPDAPVLKAPEPMYGLRPLRACQRVQHRMLSVQKGCRILTDLSAAKCACICLAVACHPRVR